MAGDGSDTMGKAQTPARMRSASDDAAALAAAIGLSIRVARARIETCSALIGNAEAALGSRQEALAIDAILDVEPLLFEAQTILNATTMLRRIVREAETAKT